MAVIEKVTKQTQNRFLNMYELDTIRKNGNRGKYFVSSRAEKVDDLKLKTHVNKPDGVIIYAVTEDNSKVLLVRQYRYPIDAYVYELPAGLVDEGEDFRTAAIREVHEETGMTLHPIEADPMFEAPRFTTVGMTDESCALVFGYVTGEPTAKYLEESEEIIQVLADREEVRRILREENVACQCAYHIVRFMQEEDSFAYVRKG
ncbi:MAG: NUDIX hydrolase [Lachnospiraceae bacterium]|nr:NUDIX hydrolase [Lachnospiraceae bacterium]